jgi:peptidoglycan/LPS O-acetylase OafA/YrhL
MDPVVRGWVGPKYPGSGILSIFMMTLGSGLFRLFLASLVMVHHSFPLRMGAWAVYVFFILSGYWICRLWRYRYIHAQNPLLTFIASRWWRLAPIFLLCTALSVASSSLLDGGGALQGATHFTWWFRELLIAGSNGAGTDLPPSWSLDVEMQFYLAAPLLIMLFARIGSFFRCLTASAACGWFILYVLRGGSDQLAHLTLFVGFFLVGAMIHLSQWKPSRTMALRNLLIFFGITLILAFYPQTQRGIWRAGLETTPTRDDFPSFAANVWWIVGAIAVVPFLAWNVSQHSPRFDRFLGNLAYPLYLFHWIPREWYYHFSLRSDPAWKQCGLLAMNFLAAAAGAIIIVLLVDRPSERLREAWVASRKKSSKESNDFSTTSCNSSDFDLTGRRNANDRIAVPVVPSVRARAGWSRPTTKVPRHDSMK